MTPVSPFKAGLKAHLIANSGVNNLVSGRVYPIAVPGGTAFPLITYKVVDAGIAKGINGQIGLRTVDVLIQAISTDSKQPDDVADAIEAALFTNIGDIGGSGVKVQDCAPADVEARVDDYMPEERLYGVNLRVIFTI